jgi:cell division septation protein DedD
MEETMKTIMQLVVLAVLLAGCSGRAAFENEILGAPPESPPAATAAGSNVGRTTPAQRDLDATPPPVESAPAAYASSPQPSVSTTSGEPLPPYAPGPAPVQPAPVAQPVQAAPGQAAGQTHSPYTPNAQAAAPAGGLLTFQVGSFAHEANAVSLRDVLAARGYQGSIEQGQTPQGKVYYRVYAKMAGTESEAKAALAALGVSDPTLVSGDPGRAAPPKAQAASAASGPAAAKAPVAPSSAQTAAASAAAPTAITGPTGQCHVDAERIAATGTSRPDAGEPLMAQKAAAQNAKRNLLLCVDAYKRKAEKIPASIKMEGYLPETLVTYTSPAYLADGSVEVGASMAVGDVDAVAFTRLE